MSSQPPSQVGQLSPDGMWRWDGQRWVPAVQAAAPPAGSPRSRNWLWWLAGGCAVLLVVGIVGGIYGMVSLVHTFQSGGLACLPSDFPKYPGATLTREYTYVGTNVAPGDSRECTETFESNDNVAAVSDFYASQLDTGDWHIIRNDKANGQINFNRQSRPASVGVVELLARGQHTTILVKLDY